MGSFCDSRFWFWLFAVPPPLKRCSHYRGLRRFEHRLPRLLTPANSSPATPAYVPPCRHHPPWLFASRLCLLTVAAGYRRLHCLTRFAGSLRTTPTARCAHRRYLLGLVCYGRLPFIPPSARTHLLPTYLPRPHPRTQRGFCSRYSTGTTRRLTYYRAPCTYAFHLLTPRRCTTVWCRYGHLCAHYLRRVTRNAFNATCTYHANGRRALDCCGTF